MKVFFTVDDDNRVFPCCDWSEDITPDADWVVGNLNGNAYDEHGIPRYKYENGQIVERTAEEIEADIDELPITEPTENEQLRADVDYLLMITEEM